MTRTYIAQKVNGFKTLAVRTLAIAALAGAAFAATPAAQAQRVVFGFRGPRVVVAAPPVAIYGGPAYYGHGYYGPDWRAREDWREREFREHRDFRDHDDHRGYGRR
jgi:hypothetical protein